MPQQYEDGHIRVCRGDVRQCETCGGRMCDCGSERWEYQVFQCIHCGQVEVDEWERNDVLALPTQ
jgi:hypothetical protein